MLARRSRVRGRAWEALNEDEGALDLPANYVVISAGASMRRLAKAWDEDKYAELIIFLYDRFSLIPVLVGAQDTRQCNTSIVEHVQRSESGRIPDIVDLTGKLGLRQLYAVLKKADLFVGIDSGVMHLASAADVPLVALFGPTDPFYVGPQNTKSIVARKDKPCMPCYLNNSCENIDCMRDLEVQDVIHACIQLLSPELS